MCYTGKLFPPDHVRLGAGTQAHQVQGQAIVGEDNDKKYEVDQQVQHISDQLQVENIDTLVLPPPFHVVVNHGQHVLKEGRHNGRCLHATALHG